jgi:hypothetical protein
LARKRELLDAATSLADRDVGVILIQIHEAHSSAWPTGLDQQPEPQSCISDRIQRANEFIAEDQPPFPVYIDTWEDKFEQTFQSWPDKYYMINRDMQVLAKSTYGTRADALIDVDCISLVRRILASDCS